MKVRKNKIVAAAATSLVGMMALTACGSNSATGEGQAPGAEGEGSSLSGNLAGAGASSMETAQTAWIAGFGAQNPDATVAYDPVGSGGGRKQFLAGGTDFGGTDAALDEKELEKGKERCFGGNALDLPVYVSPIAVAFNLPGIDTLNLSPEVIAGIFKGDIKKWNDKKIAADNPDADLPDMEITPVSRSDESGTTENFTDYLEATAGDAWGHEASGTWPIDGGQSGKGTSGVVSVAQGAEGTITYADASKVGELGTAAVQVGDEWVEYSPEAAAKTIDESPRAEGRTEGDIVVNIDRKLDSAGAYPLVLVSYLMVCDTYEEQNKADLVKAYAKYLVSDAGQKTASENAGSAPISKDLQEEINGVLDGIKVSG